MEENDIEQADSFQTLSLAKSLQSSIEPKLIEGTDEDDHNNLQKTPSASYEASMQPDLPMSLILTDNKSNLQEVSVEQTILNGDSVSLSPNTDSGELPSANEVSDDFPSSSNEAYESKEVQGDSITMQSSEVYVCAESQPLLGLIEGIQDDASCTDSDKIACVTPPAILKEVKEDKPLVVHRLQKRQMSLGDTRQKVPALVSRSISGKYLRTDKTIVDTTTHIESVKVAASKFGGSINWKARRTQPAQETGHLVLELDKLKNEISECKHQAEAVEAAKLLVINELERTRKLIEELKHVLERQHAEEVDAKEDLEFFQFILEEMEEGVASNDSVVVKEKLKIIQERHEALVFILMLVKDESRKVREEYDSLLIERDISIRKAQEAFTVSKEAERQVKDLTLELKQLKGVLDLACASCHDAEERKKGTSMARDEDCFTWEKDLRQAEEELNQFDKKLSSFEELKSKVDTSSSLLLNLKNELATCMEANQIEEAREQESGNHKSMQEEAIVSRNELEEHRRSIAVVRDKLCALKVTASALKSELDKEKAALATMQQKEAMASITVSSLKLEIKLSQQELEAVQAKEERRDRMDEFPKVLQDDSKEADEAKFTVAKAQEELRKTKEEVEQAKAGLCTMEFKLQAVLREVEAAKESERLALNALRALEDTKAAVNIEQQGSTQMITRDLDEYTSLINKSHRAEELLHGRSAAAIAQLKAAKESESRTLSRLNDILTALEERKQALLAAREQADRATEGKLAMEQELRKWREENGRRRKACEASKSGARPSSAAEIIIVERSGDANCTSKEDSYASVHPLSDVSGRSSPNDLALLAKTKKAKKLSFFPRIIMFLDRRRLKAAK